MRKFDARWWRTPLLDQWRLAIVDSGRRCQWHFIGFGYLTEEGMDELCNLTNYAAWRAYSTAEVA